MHYVYVIKSRIKNWVYVGSSSNLKERFATHNNGQVKSTQFYKPFDLVYYEAYASCGLARKRENEIKKNSQQKELLFKRIGLSEK